MKKILFGSLVVIALGGFVVWGTRSGLFSFSDSDGDSDLTTSIPSETTNPGTTSTTTSISNAPFKDGTYTGDVANSIFGDVQVAAVISGGKISNVSFLAYPKDKPQSKQISDHSMPILISEAIAAQSSKVDVVSGATQTWEAFQQSLTSALTKAQS